MEEEIKSMREWCLGSSRIIRRCETH